MSFHIHGIVRLCSLPMHKLPFYWQVTGDRVLCGWLNKPFRDLSAQCIVSHLSKVTGDTTRHVAIRHAYAVH